jgi:NADPH-dependent ferric siderophore reductase
MPTPEPTRRPPPPFRRAAVVAVVPLTPRLTRVTLAGVELRAFRSAEPAGSVRLLLPDRGGLVIPTWTGNEFRLPDGRRPTIRTLTPVAVDPDTGTLSLEIVRHGEGRASMWAGSAAPGDPAAISGPARGYVPDPAATDHVVAGDETAIPAIRQVLAAITPGVPVHVVVETATEQALLDLTPRAGLVEEWVPATPGARPGTVLADRVLELPVGGGTRVWAAGEAASMQRIRRHLFGTLGVPRAHATIRGYWKHGRTAGGDA